MYIHVLVSVCLIIVVKIQATLLPPRGSLSVCGVCVCMLVCVLVRLSSGGRLVLLGDVEGALF